MEPCAQDYYRDIHTDTCLHCRSICIEYLHTQPECDKLCPGYGATPAPVYTSVPEPEPNGDNPMIIVVAVAILAVVILTVLILCVLIKKSNKTEERDKSCIGIVSCSSSGNKLETIKEYLHTVSCVSEPELPDVVKQVPKGQIPASPQTTLKQNEIQNPVRVKRETSTRHEHRPPKTCQQNIPQDDPRQHCDTQRLLGNTRKKRGQTLSDNIDIPKQSKSTQLQSTAEQENLLNIEKASSRNSSRAPVIPGVQRAPKVPSYMVTNKENTRYPHVNQRSTGPVTPLSITHPKQLSSDPKPSCLHGYTPRIDEKSHSVYPARLQDVLQAPGTAHPVQPERVYGIDITELSVRPGSWHQTDDGRQTHDPGPRHHSKHDTVRSMSRGLSASRSEQTSGYNTTSSTVPDHDPYSDQDASEHQYLLEAANADKAGVYIDIEHDGISHTNNAPEDTMYASEIHISLIDNHSHTEIGQMVLSDRFSMATLMSSKQPTEGGAWTRNTVNPCPPNGSTFQSSNHWNKVISLFDHLEKQKHKFPWIVGCMISNDHIEVVVSLEKAGCNINDAYDDILREISADKEEFLVLTADQSGSFRSHRSYTPHHSSVQL